MIKSSTLYLLIIPQIIISVIYAINLFDRNGWFKAVFYSSFAIFILSIIGFLFKSSLIGTVFFWLYIALCVYSVLYGLFKFFFAKKT